ncbi:MAG TPA: DUF1634 domain-containing protein [Polyangiaceae bacterium]
MSVDPSAALDRRLAALLSGGTWLACALVAIGMFLPTGAWIVRAGVVVFIALPIVRVMLMTGDLARRRDWRLAAIGLGVLLVLAVGVVLGLHGRSGE